VVAAVAGLVAALVWLFASRGGSLLALFVLGLSWACLWGHLAVSHRLPVSMDKTDVTVVGTVSSIPSKDNRKQSFRFEVESLDAAGKKLPPLRTLRLSWYNSVEELALGQRWQLTLRLRAPRGFSNPGTFDYESWLFAEGLSATGYVINNRAKLLTADGSSYLTRWRHWLYKGINQHPDVDANGYLTALVLGEKGGISPAHMGQLVDNGLIHLMVVSGLHIGIMATFGFYLGTGIGRVLAALGGSVPGPITGSLFALIFACTYAALTGFGLPAQRALIMISAVLLALVWRRPVRGISVFSMALAGVALIDPLAIIRMGFWLSFAAVAALLLYFSPRPGLGKVHSLIWAQPVVFAGLAPWLLFFQGRINLLMIPFNLLFIPWISFIVTPLCLLGAILHPVPGVGSFLWDLARWQLSYFDQFLGYISGFSGVADGWYLHAAARNFKVLVIAIVAILPFLLLPRGAGLRFGGALLAIALLFGTGKENPRLALSVLDVGQGTAVVVRVGEKTLVYDTGAAFSDSFDVGSGIIAPYLASKGVRTVDKLIISHNDGDHSGGTQGLIESLKVKQILTSDPEVTENWSEGAEACRSGEHWQWQSVTFRFLWPEALSGNDNNNSCVLLIELTGERGTERRATILLPGDIEASVEKRLVTRHELDNTTLLLAPHHGSKTSSSKELVEALQPEHVIFSAGLNHHFGHPHEDVVTRYLPYSHIWSTQNSGAVEFEWHRSSGLEISASRESRRHYW